MRFAENNEYISAMKFILPTDLTGSVGRAIVLAAGNGRRLYPLTQSTPKALTKVANQEILGNLLESLLACGIRDVVVVTGHGHAQLCRFLAGFETRAAITIIENADYAKSNNVLSLWLARDYFDVDFLLLESDIVFKPAALRTLCTLPSGTHAAVISPLTPAMEGACVRLEQAPPVISPPMPLREYEHGAQSLYKTVNIYRIGGGSTAAGLSHRLGKLAERGAVHGYYEEVFADAIRNAEMRFEPVIWPGSDWYEVDNADDLAIAEYVFAAPERRLAQLRAEHGGYWRYPVADHCLLYNCHYPPSALLAHFSKRLEPLSRHYPASQRPISAFAARYFGLAEESVVIGNGVSELIRALSHLLDGKLLLPSPSFDEYETLVPSDRLLRFPLRADQGFKFPVQELAEAAIAAQVSQLVIVTPNNPTGVCMPIAQLMELLDLLRDQPIRVIVDDSFLDFSSPLDSERLLALVPTNQKLVLLRSLSKSHGIGGIRLGLLASADLALVNAVRRQTPIWNINGFAEEYLRIMGAYRREYVEACELVMHETQTLGEQLACVPGIRVFPSGANFVLCELAPQLPSAAVISARLLAEHHILVKDCSTKPMHHASRYLRIASRVSRENRRLVEAMAAVLHDYPLHSELQISADADSQCGSVP